MKKVLLVLGAVSILGAAYAEEWVSTGNRVYLDKESIVSNRPYIKYIVKYFDDNSNQDITRALSTNCARVSSFYAMLDSEPVTIHQNSPFYQSCLMACGFEYPGQKSITSTVSIDWTSYMTKLENDVRKNWIPPGDSESNNIILHFKLAKNGKLLGLHTVKSSGDNMLDQSVINAVEITAPFAPLPNEYKGDSIEIDFTFDYSVVPIEDTFIRVNL